MGWFAAHCVSLVKFADGEQDSFPLEENVVLVEAADAESAAAKAKAIGAENYDGDPVEWDGRPAAYAFVGVRKVVECEDAATIDRPSLALAVTWRPGDGTELTYSYFEVESEEELHDLMDGETVVLTCDE